MTLTTQLKEKNDDIFGVYLKIKEGMSFLLKNYELRKNLNPWDSVVDYYTLHGYTHCENVLKKLNYLLDKANLNSYELFYILSAVWLHDIGMIEHPYGDDTLKAREEHHNSSVVYFEEIFAPTYLEGEALPGRFRLTTKDKQAICSIIKYHRRKEKIKEVEEYFDRDGKDNRVFLRFLAAVFRIADGLDLDNTRAPFFIYERNKESMPYLSKIFWNQHFPITSIVPNMDKGGLIEIRFSRSKSPEGCIHKRDMVSILLQVSQDIKSEIESVAGETSPSYLDFPESYKLSLSDPIFIDDEKKANDPERIFRPKEEEEPSGWSIRENVGWGHPDEKKDKLKTRELTNYSEFQSCFVNTSKTQEFLDLVSKEYVKPYYLISPANTGKSTLLNVASWEIFKNMNGIRSYVIVIDKKIPTYDELIEHLRKYYYVEDENFICIFDRMEHIPSNIPDPEPLKELIRSLRNNHHVVWGAGRTWEEFQFTETWKKAIEEHFEIHKLPELLKGTDIEKFRPKFEDFFSDEKEMSKFWKLVLEEDEIESDSFSQLYVALQGKEMKLTDEEVKSIVKDNLKRTSSRYDKIYRTLNSWEYNIYCLTYIFPGIFKDIANNIISVFENEEMDYVDQMVEERKIEIEIGLHPIMKKVERWLGITGTHLNDESRRILEEDRTYDSIVNTCSSLLRTFFETDSEKACSSIPFFFSTRTVMSKTLLKAFVELVLRCRDEFMNFHILSYLARENPSLTGYWKELVQQKDNAPNDWLFGEVVINFGIAIAQSGESKAENKAFSDIVDLVPNGEQLYNLGVDLNNLKMIDYALVAYDKAMELDPKLACISMEWKRNCSQRVREEGRSHQSIRKGNRTRSEVCISMEWKRKCSQYVREARRSYQSIRKGHKTRSEVCNPMG